MRKLIALSVGALLATAALAAKPSGMPAASVDAIVAAVDACREATGSAGVDEGQLAASGFVAGTSNDAKGKPLDTPLRFLFKDGALIMHGPGTGCVITARLVASSDWMTVNARLNTLLHKQPFQSELGQSTWSTPPHAVQLAATGSRESPAIRAIVIYNPPEPK